MKDKTTKILIFWIVGIVLFFWMMIVDSDRGNHSERIEKLEKQVKVLNEQVLEPAVGLINE